MKIKRKLPKRPTICDRNKDNSLFSKCFSDWGRRFQNGAISFGNFDSYIDIFKEAATIIDSKENQHTYNGTLVHSMITGRYTQLP